MAVRLVKITGKWASWGLISFSISVMAVRRIISLYQFFLGEHRTPLDFSFELFGLIGSIAMFAGVILIAPLFESMADEIAHRKQAEEALVMARVDLQRHASELEIAYKEMESFSYSVSHDLRAPLRIIEGMSDIVLKDYHDKLDDEGKNLLQLIRGNTKRMGQLIRAILDLSKAGRQEMSIDEIDMEKTVTLVAGDLKAMAPERNIDVDIGKLPPAHADPTLIHQVLTNLLSNAVKFTKDREVASIEVGGRSEDGENVYYVKDNGAGFDTNYANKLFGVFQRLHSVKEFEGIGIGLSIVQRIIRRHGGRVWAEGKPDEGATFYFTLPGKEF
jgi:light-regulated signal transduction histidine kinase (bacteriophytochrome)